MLVALGGAAGLAIARLVAMVLREIGVLLAAGLAAGGALSWATSRWIASQLYGVAPQEPLTLAAAVALLLVVAAAAVSLPTWRAAQTDPMRALRQE